MLGRFEVVLRSQVEPVLRESDGRVLTLVEIRSVEPDCLMWLGVFDPRLEPGEAGYDDG